jgi:L-2-hydroxyglutarate oxidase LhgO
MFDAGIVGAGGIVGCAIARELTCRGLSVVGFEKHAMACQEISGLNSRVIHSFTKHRAVSKQSWRAKAAH